MGALRSSVILAGGAGRRIGSQKAFLEFFGVTMIERTVEVVGEVADEVVVVARDDDQAERLREVVPGARVVADPVRGFGPVAGLAAGMAAADGQLALAVGCDLPFLNPRVMELLFDLVEGHDAAVPIREGGLIEPLHAVYRAGPMARACREALAVGERRIRAPLGGLSVRNVPVELFRPMDPQLWSLYNLNTEEDLSEARRIEEVRCGGGGPGIPRRRPGRRSQPLRESR
ncbi:MAG: putative molybdenum cofactor guanylyltransferase [Methanothrix sp.]|jgi:molybdopterin-guanine dinucleotide biosynthesis protein A|nr:MAG: putative molybdenum cofactor guanylyltransferase [Methanothrix sp.]